MLKRDKIFFSVLAGVFVVVLLVLLLRSNEIWPMGYEKIDLNSEYAKVSCYRFGKEVKVITDESEIKEFISKIGDVKVRNEDWYDSLRAKIQKKSANSSKYSIVLENKEGKEIRLYLDSKLCKDADIDYVKSFCED